MLIQKIWVAILGFGLTASHAADINLKIVASTPDMAAIAIAVGGTDVDVRTIIAGTEDPHEVDPKPSFAQKLDSADLVIANGLGLEDHWLLPLIKQSSILKSKLPTAFIELGGSISPLEDIEEKQHSGNQRHIHSKGNPHFTLDPERVGTASQTLAERFGKLDPKHRTDYLRRASLFQKSLQETTARLRVSLAKLKINGVLSYHASLNYFAQRFDLKVAGTLEDSEGNQPTAQHLNTLLNDKAYESVDLILLENLYPDLLAKKVVASRPKIHIARIPISIGAEPQITTFERLYETIARRIEAAVQ